MFVCVINSLKKWGMVIGGLCALSGEAPAVEVILSGGVALKSWEHLRGPAKHDNWWANFVRAATVRMTQARKENPSARITWIVFRPSYITRGREDGKEYLGMIRELASKYKANLVFADNADQVYSAINAAASGNDRITAFYYFGHSNAHAFMLDYSNNIIGASKHWIHEDDLAKRIRRSVFAPNARCVSYGCYTGRSMSRKWKAAFGVPMSGNTESTRYQPVGDGRLPDGVGRWVE